jgi:predicted rRNA methylase YqxC with S4 and FtsJ domains
MFNQDFFPTPKNVILQMLEGFDITGKTILEPSAGKGDLVDFLLQNGASNVIACESNQDLKKILFTKCKIIADDFLTVESHQISHIDFIIMNPPFSADDKHILHAYEIAPEGCTIISLCNLSTIKNTYSETRKRLENIVENFGAWENLGDCFSQSERKTGVDIALIKIKKTGNSYNKEFEGFFLEEDPEEDQFNGILPYNVVRDLVNRYVAAVKLFDEQIQVGIKMNALTSGFYKSDISFSCTSEGQPALRTNFKKDLQKSGWNFIFEKMNMQKYATRGLRDDINKFVEKQQNIPFTMKNIYRMLEIVIGTQESRMDKAILEVFDKVTSHHKDNRYNIEGWKTNSHYFLTKRFIMPTLTKVGYSGQVESNHSSNFGMVEDLIKTLCYITGDNYSDMISLEDFIFYPYLLMKDGKYMNDSNYDYDLKIKEKTLEKITDRQSRRPGTEIQHNEIVFGKWFDWGYFKARAYKKGTMHFEFKDEKVWGMFNQRVAKLKGYPLYEHKETSKPNYSPKKQPVKPVILATIRI